MAEMEKSADWIVVGKIDKISPASWNQDSGEYYQDSSSMALPVHYITISVSRYIEGAKSSDSLVVTVVGVSPTGVLTANINGASTTVEGKPDHDLAEGDQAIFFLRNTQITWRGGARPAIMLMGVPSQSYLKQGSDGSYHGGPDGISAGLDTVIADIAKARAS